jgi:O-antigen ligase
MLARMRTFLVCAVLFVVPLVFWPWLRDAYHIVKEGGILLFGVPALFAWWMEGRPGWKDIPAWYRWTAGAFLIWVVSRALGGGPDPVSGRIQAGEWLLVFTMAAAGMGLDGPVRRRALIYLVAGTALVCLVGIAQHVFGWTFLVPYKMDPRSITFTKERVFSTFGNPIFFAGHLVLVVPLTLAALASEAPETRRRKYWAAALLLEIIALLFASSRAAFIGLAAGGAVMALAVPQLRKWLARAGVVAALAVGVMWLVRPELVSHALVLGDPGRMMMWKASLKMAGDSPLLGVGTGNFTALYPCAQVAVASPGETGFGVNAVYAHNEYLQAAAEWGFPGLLLMMAALFGMLKAFPARDFLGWGVRAGTVGIAVHALFNFPFHVAPTAGFTWLLPAVFLSGDSRQEAPSRRAAFVALPVILILAALMFRPFLRSSYIQWALAYQDARIYQKSADCFDGALRLLADDSQARIIFHSGKMRFEAGDLVGAQVAFEEDLARFPCYPESYGNMGVIYGVRAMNGEADALVKAESLVEKALSIRPGGREAATDYNSLGNLRVLAGKKRAAIESYRQALKYEPGFTEAASNTARLLIESGDRRGAVEVLESALANNPEDRELASILASVGGRR